MGRKGSLTIIGAAFVLMLASAASSQEKKLERIRVGGGSASGTQLSMWLATD